MGLFAKLFGKKRADKNKKNEKASAPKQETPKHIQHPAPQSNPKEEINSTPTKKPACPAQDAKKSSAQPKKSEPAKTEAKKASAPMPRSERPTPSKPIKSDEDAAEKISVDKASETVNVKGLSGFFDIKKSKDGRYVFNLYASNRVIIATSQIYSSSSAALNGANSVIANAARANIEDQTIPGYEEKSFPKWEIYKDKAGQFRFRLSSSNGSCICHSQGYKAKASCKNGIESIIRTVGSASIDKNYLKKD